MILSGALSYYTICAAYKQITTGETREFPMAQESPETVKDSGRTRQGARRVGSEGQDIR